MIQIIKMGRVPITTPEYRTTCYYCNTIFEHNKFDCIFIPSAKEFYLEKVECPLCKNKVQPQKLKAPPDVPKPAEPLTAPPRPVYPNSATYELISDYVVLAKKIFKFNPKRK